MWIACFAEMPPPPPKPQGGSSAKPQGGSSGAKPQSGAAGYNPSSSSSLKPKSSTGMKIIWIPGRKKQHDKGVFRPTNQNVEYKHGERKNEVWSLGGSKSHDNILAGRR